MKKILITNVHARQILDSRGNPTVEVDVEVNKKIVYYYGEDNIIELKLFAITEQGESVLSAMGHNFLPSYEEMKKQD